MAKQVFHLQLPMLRAKELDGTSAIRLALVQLSEGIKTFEGFRILLSKNTIR